MQSGYGQANRERREQKNEKHIQACPAEIGEVGKTATATPKAKAGREKKGHSRKIQTAPRETYCTKDTADPGASAPQASDAQANYARAAVSAKSASEGRAGDDL